MGKDFEGKVVLITGAARGLGKCAAIQFAEQGASLFLIDRLAEQLEETRAELAANGAIVQVMAADISSREVCFAAVEAAIAAFGKLDVLCNCAAIVRMNHVPDISADEWNSLLAINLSAPFHFCQAAIPHLLKTHGNIVNVASQTAFVGSAYLVAYSATKAAIVQMTKSMAMEYIKQPIRINAVAPGTMNTPIATGVWAPKDLDRSLAARYYGIREPAEPEDVAALIVFTASDKARAIHGTCLTADGGSAAG